jgi:hypothetical protein
LQSLSELTLLEMRKRCFKDTNLCSLLSFNQHFKNEGYVELSCVNWQSKGAACLLLNLKDGVVPLYFIGVGKELLHLKVIAVEELEGIAKLLKQTRDNIAIVNKWLIKERIPAWYSLAEFLIKQLASAEAIYEEVAPREAFYAFSYPDDYGSGYLLFPLEEAIYICPYSCMKSGGGYVYHPAEMRVLRESDQTLMKNILSYQLKTEKIVSDLIHQNRLAALFKAKK